MFKKLFGSVSSAKEAQKDVESFKQNTTTINQQQQQQQQQASTTTTTSSNTTPPVISTSTTPTKPKSTDDKTVASLFEQYLQISKDEDITSDCITISGLIKFAEDLEVDPQDIVMLILLYKIGSTKQYVVTKDQFINGFKSMNCNNLDQIKSALPKLRQEFNQPKSALFREVYNFSFDYNKEPEQKGFAAEDAAATWTLLLGGKYEKIEAWNEFILKNGRPIQRDTWKLFLNFVQDIGTDISKYQDDGSWPTIIDDFVEMLRENK